MLKRGEFNILSYSGMRTYQIERPRYCAGFFYFTGSYCVRCPFRVECESQFVTEFGYSGRPVTILKEYFYATPFLHKIILPDKVKELFPYLVPKHLPSKIRGIIRRQLRVVYKMHVRSELFTLWDVFALKHGDYIDYFSKLTPVEVYFDLFNDDQVKRVAFTSRSLISRLCNNKPTALITCEVTGLMIERIAEISHFEYTDFMFWIDIGGKEGKKLRKALSELTPLQLNRRKIPFVQLKVPAVVIWQVTKGSFLKVYSWVVFNNSKIKYLVVLSPELKYINFLQSCFYPLTLLFATGNLHFPFIAVYKVIPLKRGKKFS